MDTYHVEQSIRQGETVFLVVDANAHPIGLFDMRERAQEYADAKNKEVNRRVRVS